MLLLLWGHYQGCQKSCSPIRVALLCAAPWQPGLHKAFLLIFPPVREPGHACFGLEAPGPIRKRPLSAEFPPVPPWPACVAVPLLALERRYPRAAPGVFACDLALDPVRPWIGSDMSARLLSASGRILRPKTASPPFCRSCSQSTTGVH